MYHGGILVVFPGSDQNLHEAGCQYKLLLH